MTGDFEIVEEIVEQKGLFVTNKRVYMCDSLSQAEALTNFLAEAAKAFWASVPEHVHITEEKESFNGK